MTHQDSRVARAYQEYREARAGGPTMPPETDPTNPYHQEAVGIFVAAELANERRVAEPGLTDLDRQHRAIV